MFIILYWLVHSFSNFVILWPCKIMYYFMWPFSLTINEKDSSAQCCRSLSHWTAGTETPLQSLHTYNKLYNVLLQSQQYLQNILLVADTFPKITYIKSYWLDKSVCGYDYILNNSSEFVTHSLRNHWCYFLSLEINVLYLDNDAYVYWKAWI